MSEEQRIEYKGPPRDKVAVALPCYDYKIECACVAGLMQCMAFYERPLFWAGMSNIALARNEIAHIFVEDLNWQQFDWLVMIDSDTGFSVEDWFYLMEGDEKIVVAEYARKILGEPPVQFGLGFCKVHRSVFEDIKALIHPEQGNERVNRFYHKGAMMVDYFPNGAIEGGRWIGEDQGFFMWAALAGAQPRIEKRTRLTHMGRFAYSYPQQIPGVNFARKSDPLSTNPNAFAASSQMPCEECGTLGGDHEIGCSRAYPETSVGRKSPV